MTLTESKSGQFPLPKPSQKYPPHIPIKYGFSGLPYGDTGMSRPGLSFLFIRMSGDETLIHVGFFQPRVVTAGNESAGNY
jgi:hypothetical protein